MPKLLYYCFATYVSDLDESKVFYERLGYKAASIGDTEEYLYLNMEPHAGAGAVIQLREPFQYGEKSGRTATVFTPDIDHDKSEGEVQRAEQEIIEDLIYRGFHFANLTPREFFIGAMPDTLEMVDPQGARMKSYLGLDASPKRVLPGTLKREGSTFFLPFKITMLNRKTIRR